jgi:hypothetical protein
MSSIHFIGGEKGGVGKSVVARVLAQYFIDHDKHFVGFDTDRSHTSFTRFYAEYASPVIVDTFEGLDKIVSIYESEDENTPKPHVIVDLAAQTAAPLAKWIKESDLINLMYSMQIGVNFWHVAEAGKDSVDLLDRLISTYGAGPNYIVVKNEGRGTDFSQLDASNALNAAKALGAKTINLAQLHEGSMRKIDRRNASFWSAIHTRNTEDSLGMLERQRVRFWIKGAYAAIDSLNLT